MHVWMYLNGTNYYVLMNRIMTSAAKYGYSARYFEKVVLELSEENNSNNREQYALFVIVFRNNLTICVAVITKYIRQLRKHFLVLVDNQRNTSLS